MTAYNIVPTLQWIVLCRIYLAVINSAAVSSDVLGLPPCTGLVSVLTGCTSTMSGLFAAAVGVVTGAPPVANIVILSVVNGPPLLWAFMTWARGN